MSFALYKKLLRRQQRLSLRAFLRFVCRCWLHRQPGTDIPLAVPTAPLYENVGNMRRRAGSSSGSKVAYITSRFPTFTETFILDEILEHQRRGNLIEIYSLMRHREALIDLADLLRGRWRPAEAITDPDVLAVIGRVHFRPFISFSILAANWHYLRRRPRAYLSAIAEVLRGTFGSTNFFLGAIAFLPKSAAFAYDMERSGVTHVHAHFATHPALSALIIHRLTGIPFSFTAHGHDVHCDCRMLGEKLAAAEFAVAVSEYNRALIVRECGEQFREKIHVVHCGVDTGYFAPVTFTRPPRPLRIVCVATLREVKGHSYLVEACHLLRQRGIAFHCDLIGGGELQSRIETQIASTGLCDVFTLHGPQPRNVVRRALQESDLAVLPSVLASNGMREGIPVSLMEAMACGLPVVSSALSGIPELVKAGVSGILVAPRDSAALADALEQLERDGALRARMGHAGRNKVAHEFNRAANTAALAALFAGERTQTRGQTLREELNIA